MIEKMIWVAGIFLLSGVFWYCIFYQKEKRLLNRLQQMLDHAIDGELERTEISEEKYSALENSMKHYLDSSFLDRKNQQEQKEVIQKLISDIAHQTLTPISNLKIYGELLESVCQGFTAKAREKDISLSVCDTDLYVICDLKWTAEALGNIVDNAIKYTPEGGKVQLKVEKYSSFVKVDVIDDGIGIKKEEIPKIFGRFYRSLSVADQPGVGVGLFLAREIIQAQKGYVKVKSEIGKGSTFSVFLPV